MTSFLGGLMVLPRISWLVFWAVRDKIRENRHRKRDKYYDLNDSQ